MGDTPPRPDVEFDFHLPHGIDAEEDIQDDRSNADLYDQHMDQLHPAYNVLENGFSDDDDAPEAFDRSWSGHQARKPPPKDRKSPRTDDEEDDMSPSNKRPRPSLFGGLTGEAEESQDRMLKDPPENPCETNTPGKHDTVQELGMPDLDITDALPSPISDPPLSDLSFNAGSGLSDSDRDSMSPRNSPEQSADTVIIPPDTQVRSPTFQSP